MRSRPWWRFRCRSTWCHSTTSYIVVATWTPAGPNTSPPLGGCGDRRKQEHHASIVRDTATTRSVIHQANEVLRDAYDRTRPAAELVATFRERLDALHGDGGLKSRWPDPVPITELEGDDANLEWICEGMIARRHVTLFSALFKAGKTTALSHRLRALQRGKPFFGRPTKKYGPCSSRKSRRPSGADAATCSGSIRLCR